MSQLGIKFHLNEWRINRTQPEVFSGHSCKSAFQPYKIHPRVIRHLSTMRFVPLPSLITRRSRENLHKKIQTINPNILHEPGIAQGTKTAKKRPVVLSTTATRGRRRLTKGARRRLLRRPAPLAPPNGGPWGSGRRFKTSLRCAYKSTYSLGLRGCRSITSCFIVQ